MRLIMRALNISILIPLIFALAGAAACVAWLTHNPSSDLTLRGVTREATLDVRYQGCWDTPFWEDGEDKGPLKRAGFHATTTIDRRDYGVSWNGEMAMGGVVVGHDVLITIDAEALLQD